MHRGYFALWRRVEDHPFYKEPREFSKYEAWLDILMNAQHETEPQKVSIGMKVLTCNYGESLKSNVTWAKRWSWSEAKVRRFLKLLKKLGQISTKSEGITTRIIVINYSIYDPRRRQGDDNVTSMRRDHDEQVTTDNKVKNVKNIYIVPFEEIVSHLNEKAGTKFKHTTKDTRGHIKARWSEGFRLEDFITVIDKKTEDWKSDPKMSEFLRPKTLFGTKFEDYLNAAKRAPSNEPITMGMMIK